MSGRRRITTNGVELDVTDAGSPGDPLVVLVHGFPESSHSWRHQVDPLVAAPRFNAGSADVTFEHGAQLDRVANVLNALPNVTVTVVGHADQVGDEAANYALSEARAVSVVRYLVSKGVDPSRLAARAVGEQDLLSEDASDASLALNRRTEFIFYGLLAD
jgi:outer membrane protein OmpA-like peptidoglycan-associated protein